MKATNFTRQQLAEYILHTAKDSVVAKFKAILEKENEEEIVAYTSQGEPLTKEAYKIYVEAISKDIENGAKTYTSQEVKDYVLNRKARQG